MKNILRFLPSVKMSMLKAKIRKEPGKGNQALREQGFLPAIVYGPEIENLPLKVRLQEFNGVYQESGETSLVSLEVDDQTFKVLIHDLQYHPVTDQFIHADFYQPLLGEEVTATIPLSFIGEAPAVEDLGGTLVKNISEIEVQALPEELPREIKVEVGKLETFQDEVLVKELKVKPEIEIQRAPEEIVASVVPPREEEEVERAREGVAFEEEIPVEEVVIGEEEEEEELEEGLEEERELEQEVPSEEQEQLEE